MLLWIDGMAGFKTSNRLSPPLMWVFRSAAEQRDARKDLTERMDKDGQHVVAGRKGAQIAAITEPMLRAQVWRDLEQLLNTIAMESSVPEVRRLNHVRTSVLNYGLPDISHRAIDELLANDRTVEREIEAALNTYEPRLIPGSISVRLDTGVDTVGLKVRFIVRADLSCRPVDIPLEFTADVEVVNGKITLSRL